MTEFSPRFEPQPDGAKAPNPPAQANAQLPPTSPPPAPPEPPAERRPRALKIVLGIFAGLLAIAMVGANVWMSSAIDDAKTRSEDALKAAESVGADLAAAKTKSAELQAAVDVLQDQVTHATELKTTLDADIATETTLTDSWRDVTTQLVACDKARKKVIDNIHHGGSTSESSADKTCNAALAAYKKQKGKS